MTQYRLSDEGSSEVIEAESMEDACEQARKSWELGSWDNKALITVTVAELDDDGEPTGEVDWVEIEVGEDPEPPECTEDEHEWCSPVSVVGGLPQNPGVFGKGGTTILTVEVCGHCGCYRRSTSYGSQRDLGQVDTVEYMPPDQASLAYIAQE